MTDYGKLAELYGGFLVAIGGVSITVLTLVMSIWHRPASGTLAESEVAIHNRAALIKALIIATFCSFVGAHLMAETAAFVAAHDKGFGARQFLLAGVNIFVGVTIVMFAVMLLATEYKKENQQLLGIRNMAKWVFGFVVLCVLWWMAVSILLRMPPTNKGWSAVLPFCLVAILMIGVFGIIWKKKGNTKALKYLLRGTFVVVIATTVLSLVFFSLSLSDPSEQITTRDAVFFVSTITLICSSLFCYGICAGRAVPNLKAWTVF